MWSEAPVGRDTTSRLERRRRLQRKKLAREGFVDDGDASGRSGIRIGKAAAVTQRDSHRAEITGRDFAIVDAVPLRIAGADQLDSVVAAALERQTGGHDARSFDAGRRFEARDQSVIEI